jgi:hypothetical protein
MFSCAALSKTLKMWMALFYLLISLLDWSGTESTATEATYCPLVRVHNDCGAFSGKNE